MNEETETIKRKKNRFFESHIVKLLKILNNNGGITVNAKQQLNSAICYIAKNITNISLKFVMVSGKKTISHIEIENSVKFLLEEKLCEIVLNNAKLSIETYENNNSEKHSSRQEKAGIIFPPSITEKFLRNFEQSSFMVTKTSPVFLASVLETITKQILLHSIDISKTENHVRITIRDLELSIQKNKELTDLFSKCKLSFVGGGVLPYIHSFLLTKKPKKKKQENLNLPINFVTTKKPHRFRPGTVSLREIKIYQKTSDCFMFPKFPFKQVIRNIIIKHNPNIKISKHVFTILQHYIEQYLINFLRNVNSLTVYSERVKMSKKDIEFIQNLKLRS